jgi:hypothetical protein
MLSSTITYAFPQISWLITYQASCEWNKLRDILKYKIKQNAQQFLDAPPPPPPPEFSLEPSTPAGLRIAPLPPKKRDALTSLPVPVNRMNESETKEMLVGIFELIHGFDEGCASLSFSLVYQILNHN